jgi:CheY-like chemotaxis protein
LLVEDEVALARSGQLWLERLGYGVVVCTSSTEALRLFRATPEAFDLLITDYTLPDMTGEVLARELRRMQPDLPIILCTGFSPTMTAEKAAAVGIQTYLMKPVGLRELSHAIRRALDASQT